MERNIIILMAVIMVVAVGALFLAARGAVAPQNTPPQPTTPEVVQEATNTPAVEPVVGTEFKIE